MKNRILILIRWLVFASVIVFLLMQLTPYFENRKSADDVYETFQEMKDIPDVFVLGTSRAQLGIDPNIIYQNYGIKVFNLSAPSQHLDTIEYVMDSAIQQKKPKVIMVVTDYMEDVTMKSTLNHEILSIRKLNANVSSKWNYMFSHFGFQSMEYVKFYFPIFQFHEDFLEGKIDAESIKENGHLKRLYQKGFSYNEDVEEISLPYVDAEQKQVDEDVMNYLEKLNEKCNEQGISLVYVTLPTASDFPYSVDMEQHFKYLNCLDFLDKIGIDEKTDFGDEQHLNANGAAKVSDFLGAYLSANFDLQDYRQLGENNLWDITLPTYIEMGYTSFDEDEWEKKLLKEGYEVF